MTETPRDLNLRKTVTQPPRTNFSASGTWILDVQQRDRLINRAHHPGRAEKFQASEMNRSFSNKSQSLRSLNMNAVEVKSKVSCMKCMLEKYFTRIVSLNS